MVDDVITILPLTPLYTISGCTAQKISSVAYDNNIMPPTGLGRLESGVGWRTEPRVGRRASSWSQGI